MDADKNYCKDAPEEVNHPKHYTSLGAKCEKCGEPIEVIQISEKLCFCLGNAIKYILRSDFKGNAIKDLEKSVWYLNRHIESLKKEKENG
jgi:hypothetical protein